MESEERLHRLATEYKNRAGQSKNWADYLKAHGLANSCLYKSQSEEIRELVYEIENLWYSGSHPLSFTEHKILTQKHKEMLNKFRGDTKWNLNALKGKEQAFINDDMFSERGLQKAEQFANDIFEMSKKCSKHFVQVSRTIMESSVAVLKSVGQNPPCSFAVIGLGSVARGEATPYSDLEYAFIVESHSNGEYFKRLAVDSYFRIGNFCETPLKCFNIDEVPWRADYSDITVGYRIDGISDIAGNIPTGNPGGQSLTLTIPELLKLYKESLRSELGELAGDIADLLSSAVLIYHNNGGDQLYHTAVKALAEELEVAKLEESVISKRLRKVEMDVKGYDFLPKFKSFGPPDNTDIKVKSHIFRYPTLLAFHLKLSIAPDSSHPWDVYLKLHESGLLSYDNYRYMNIVLALSIYIRTSAYLALQTQSDEISLYTTSSSGNEKDLYHVPRNIFVLLGCLLIPIKLAVRSNVGKCLLSSSSDSLKLLLTNIDVSSSNFMLKVEVLFFTGDHTGALKELYKAGGETSVNEMSESFLDLTRKMCSQMHEKKALEICSYLLWSAKKYQFALKYLNRLRTLEVSGSLHLVRWELLASECYNKIHNYREAMALLSAVLHWLRGRFQIKEQQSIPKHVLDTMSNKSGALTNEQSSLIELTVHAYRIIGDTCRYLKLFAYGEEVIEICGILCESLSHSLPEASKIAASLQNALGDLLSDIGKFPLSLQSYMKTLSMLKTIHGKHTNHPSIAECYNSMGTLFSRTGLYAVSLEYYMKALDIIEVIHQEDAKHIEMAICFRKIGSVHLEMGAYSKALEFYNKTLEIWKRVDGKEANKPSVGLANCYTCIGDVHSKMEDYETSLKYYKLSLDMIENEFGKLNHPEIARVHSKIGWIHILMKDNASALESHNRSLNMMLLVHHDVYPQMDKLVQVYSDMGNYTVTLQRHKKLLNVNKLVVPEGINHSYIAECHYDIGSTYHEMGEYSKSMEHLNKCLDIAKAIFGASAIHPLISCANNYIGRTYTVMGDYTKSLDFLKLCLEMETSTYGIDADHPAIAAVYSNLGNLYDSMGKFTEALEYYTKSLNIRKKVYGNEANHKAIASSYHNIGLVYMKLGEYGKSLKHCSMCLDIQKAIHGENGNHPDIAVTYNNIGILYSDLGQYPKSIEFYTKSLDIQKADYGEYAKHPDISSTYNGMGDVYRKIGSYAKSLECYDKCLEIRKTVYGDNTHPDIAQTYNNIGLVYKVLGENVKALEHYTKCLDIQKVVYSDNLNHPLIDVTYNNIGDLFCSIGDYDKSIEYYTRCLDIQKAVYGVEGKHPSLATSYNNMGFSYYSLGEFSKSLEYYQQCIHIQQVVYGDGANHPEMIATYNNIGMVYGSLEEHSTSLEYYYKCLDMHKSVHGEDGNHPDIAGSYNNIAFVHKRLGEYDKALENFTKCLDILHRVFGENSNHPYISATQASIDNILHTQEIFG